MRQTENVSALFLAKMHGASCGIVRETAWVGLRKGKGMHTCYSAAYIVSYRVSEDSGTAPVCPHLHHNNHVKSSNTWRFINHLLTYLLTYLLTVFHRNPLYVICYVILSGHMKISRRNAITGTNPYCWTLTDPRGGIILNKYYNNE